MISYGALLLSMMADVTSGSVPVRHVIETPEAVYFEPTAPDQQNIVWVYPKTLIRVNRYGPDPTYLQVDLALRDVQLAADLTALEPSWRGKQALFYQVKASSECTLTQYPTMRFVQQWVLAKDVTIPGAQRSAICSFTFQLRPETEEQLRRLEEDARAGTLIVHGLELQLGVTSVEPLRWAVLHAGLLSGGMEVGIPRKCELAAFELGLLREMRALQNQPPAVKQAFLEASLRKLFNWDGNSPEVQLSPTAPAGQYEFPSVPRDISL